MARGLSQMRRLSSVPGRIVHLFRSGRQNILQTRLHEVSFVVIIALVLTTKVITATYRTEEGQLISTISIDMSTHTRAGIGHFITLDL